MPEETKKDTRVELFVPRDADSDPNLVVFINGRSYLLPKGKRSMVPPEVKYEVERAQRAQTKADDNAAELQKQQLNNLQQLNLQ